jgi:hypothetical protein
VDKVTVCAAGFGGAVKFSVVALNTKSDGAGVTTIVTGTVTGVATPVTVTVMVEVYVLAVSVVGFTFTLRLAGNLPLEGVTVSHRSVAGVDTVKFGAPELAFTETVCAVGSAEAPIWYVKLTLAGFAVIVTVCACNATAIMLHRRSKVLTPGLSVIAVKV